MDNVIENAENAELADRLNMIEEPEQIFDWGQFREAWLTLKEASIKVDKSTRWVRNLCNEEKIESKTFVGGKFGNRPVRCVNKTQFQAWFQAYIQKQPEQVNVQEKTPEFTQGQALTNIMNFRDTVQGLSGSMTQLNENMRDSRTQMMDIFKEVMTQGKDGLNKWHEIQAKRAEADREARELQKETIALQREQVRAQESLINKITEQTKEQQETISKVTAQPKSSPALWIVPVASLVIALAVIGSLIYWGASFIGRQAQERDKALSTMEMQISAVERDYNRTLVEMAQKNKEIDQLKDIVIANQGNRK